MQGRHTCRCPAPCRACLPAEHGRWYRIGDRLELGATPSSSARLAAQAVAQELEIQLEALPGMTAALRWEPGLFTLDDAIKHDGGGVYVAIDTHTDHAPLKVGVAAQFRTRMPSYRALERTTPGLRFHLGRIMRGRIGSHGIGGVDKAIENAMARTLLRAGEALPLHHKPIKPAKVKGKLAIANLLPPAMRGRLHAAYTATGSDARKQNIPGATKTTPYGAIDKRRRSLVLDPKTHKRWELEWGGP